MPAISIRYRIIGSIWMIPCVTLVAFHAAAIDDMELDTHSLDQPDSAHVDHSNPAADDHSESHSNNPAAQPHPPAESHQDSSQPSSPKKISDINIATIKNPTPISHKVLTNANISVPISDNKTVLDMARFWEILAAAQNYRAEGEFDKAQLLCVQLLETPTPEDINRLALLELSYILEEKNDYPAANQVLSQYIIYYNKADNISEVYLRQGNLLRKIGSVDLALGKFYAAMSSAMNFGENDSDRYRRIALLAQTEIADTQYEAGHFKEAIELYRRILKQPHPDLNVEFIEYKLLKAMLPNSKPINIYNTCQNYIQKFPYSEYSPEIMFIKATKLLEMNDDSQTMETVLDLLRRKPEDFLTTAEQLIPWQQKAGNLLANALYEKQDYLASRSIYQSLSNMDTNPNWVIPATYQFALCSERLNQIEDATDAYMKILAIGHTLEKNQRNLQVRTLLEMTEFRLDQLNWLNEAHQKGRSLLDPSVPPGQFQSVNDDKNLNWLASVYSKMPDKTAARILVKMNPTDISGILSKMPSKRQSTLLRQISTQGDNGKSLAGAVAMTLGLPKQLAEIPVD